MQLISGQHLCEYITLAIWYFHYFWLSAFSLHHMHSLLYHSNMTHKPYQLPYVHVAYKSKMKGYNISIFGEEYLDYVENWVNKECIHFQWTL